MLPNTEYQGNDLEGECGLQPDFWKRETPEECQALCEATPSCEQFTWVSPENLWVKGRKRCCLKDALGPAIVNSKGSISGPKRCNNIQKKRSVSGK